MNEFDIFFYSWIIKFWSVTAEMGHNNFPCICWICVRNFDWIFLLLNACFICISSIWESDQVINFWNKLIILFDEHLINIMPTSNIVPKFWQVSRILLIVFHADRFYLEIKIFSEWSSEIPDQQFILNCWWKIVLTKMQIPMNFKILSEENFIFKYIELATKDLPSETSEKSWWWE